MKKDDELQYMPMMRGRIGYTNDEFKKTHINNNGKRKGTVRWNSKKIVFTLAALGTTFVVATGAIKGFDGLKGSPTTGPEPIDPGFGIEQVDYEQVERVICDYKVKVGDTLDGVIYDYLDGYTAPYESAADEKDRYKEKVVYYNDIENDMIYAGEVVTLIGVPEPKKDEFNTGYDPTVDNKDEISVSLNAAVQEMVEKQTANGGVIITNSIPDGVVKALEVYNGTTNKKARSFLSHRMWTQLNNIEEYGSVSVEDNGTRKR